MYIYHTPPQVKITDRFPLPENSMYLVPEERWVTQVEVP